MLGIRATLISCIALGGIVIPTFASDGEVTVVRSPGPGLIVPMQASDHSHELTQIYSFQRDAVGVIAQSRSIDPNLVQLQMNNVPIYVDPDQNYYRRTGGIDQGHSIIRAQRAYNAMAGSDNAYVIRRGQMQPMMDRAMITPRAILIRPDYMQRREGQQPQQSIPMPKTPNAKQGPVASTQ
jgi:hypothetical protein